MAMTENKETFSVKNLKTVLEKEIEARSAKYYSDQVPTAHRQDEMSSITRYINTQEIERMLEGIISRLGGGALEQGMVFVSVKDKNGSFVSPDGGCDKIFVSVAFGQELIINNREYPRKEDGAGTTKSQPVLKQAGSTIHASDAPQSGTTSEKTSKPAVGSDGKPAKKESLDDDHTKARQIQLAKELKRKLDELWINRKGLGVDFNNRGALKIELLQDSNRISKIVQEIGKEILDVGIDKEAGLIKVYAGDKIYLKWKFPREKI